MLIDTHAHIHHPGLVERADEVMANAAAEGVTTIINVGVTEQDSRQAVAMAERFDNVYATVGLHPNDYDGDSAHSAEAIRTITELLAHPKVVAIGECGLDFSRPPRGLDDQEAIFRAQIELALAHNLPMVWHVRDAFDDFFCIVDDYPDVRGIVHCFTSTRYNLDKAVERNFLVALNGIMTFTKDEAQLEVARAVPLDNLVLETDEPAYLKLTAQFLAELRGESLEDLARATSQNAKQLFGLS